MQDNRSWQKIIEEPQQEDKIEEEGNIDLIFKFIILQTKKKVFHKGIEQYLNNSISNMNSTKVNNQRIEFEDE